MNARIIEIFRSIQGEGKYLGVAQVFVRFFECNMHCSWCDTPQSIGDSLREYKEVGSAELLTQVKGLYEGCHSVSITGGEPLMQVEFLKEFLPLLRQERIKVYLETNGIFPSELAQVIDWVDVVAMDLKLPSSTKEKEFWDEHADFLRIALKREAFVKVVITKDTVDEDIETAVDLVKTINDQTLFILQPNYLDMKTGAVERCMSMYNYCAGHLKDVRIIPQVHKFMKLR